MRTMEEIYKTPVGLLTDEEIAMLDPAGQQYARKVKTIMAREAACPGHEREDTGTADDHRYGWHPGRCRRCGRDMSYDSSG